MARILLGVTGSVAAIRTPDLCLSLHRAGHSVKVVATEPALYFFDPEALPLPPDATGRRPLFRDTDEWSGGRYQRGDPVLHIEFRKWADILIIAPLDANTLAKLALGLCDNFLTCVFRAWDFERPVILAPAMNTLMWENPVTLRHLRQIATDQGDESTNQTTWTIELAPELFARHAPKVLLIPPQSKRLACGDVGSGAMAEVTTIAEAVRVWGSLPESKDGSIEEL